jgi:hypothetical protein
MPKVFLLPILRPHQYDAFRREIGLDLANSYDEWAKLFADDLAKAQRRGDSTFEVEVDYDEFIRYCSAEGHKPDAELLRRFAVFKKATSKG